VAEWELMYGQTLTMIIQSAFDHRFWLFQLAGYFGFAARSEKPPPFPKKKKKPSEAQKNKHELRIIATCMTSEYGMPRTIFRP